MYLYNSTEIEEQNKKIGKIISLIIHALLLLLLLIQFQVLQPENQDSGILVTLGDPDVGRDFPELAEEIVPSEPTPPTSSAVAPSKSDETLAAENLEEEAPIKAKEEKPKKVIEKKPVTDTKTKDAKEKADAKAKADREALAAKNAKEATEAKKARDKADQEAKEAAEKAKKKKQLADLFGGGSGSNNKSGNEGSNSGDPDGKVLGGITKGSGRVGGGLGGRGVEFEPKFTDNSQKTGRVSLSICVNSDGKVTSADYTQKGSTTTDAYLINLAKTTAKKYKFSKSEINSQCGTVTIDFKVN